MRFVLPLEALHLHAELFGEDGVEENADEGGERQTGDGDGADLHTAVCAVLHANRHHEDEGGNKHVARRREVDRGFNEVAHADGRNHAIENEAHAADGGSRHQSDEAGEFGAETEQDGEAGRQADHGGVKHFREVEHACVLAVRRVGRCPEERS